ncbi:LIC_13387 family protein [Nocardia transvalensis]|uniref:LIC_13387 family protein n=1 Tax=Nocardia transvalensis TaxID=37333 RepID=UPI0018961464|nr:hypothetical protein [Nocardia transvalensis]MBF6332044.1 hypothetical protein [Nocardia transvalensis]
MTSASTTVTPRWPLVVHLTGAALISVLGLAHLLAVHAFAEEGSAGEQIVEKISAATPSPMFEGGRQVTVLDLNTGYSVGMGLLGVVFGILAIVAARGAPQLITRWSLFGGTCTAAAAGILWIACLYFPEPAIIFSGLATLCFAAVLVAGPRPARRAGENP